jgi:uncharacterized protein (TIRG00374 family)
MRAGERMKKLMTAAGIVLSGVLLWLAVKDVDSGEISRSFRDADVVLAAPLLLALAGFYCLKAVRWSDILAPTARIRARELIPSMMSGAAGNNLLPAHMGEIMRAYLLGRQYRLPQSGLLATLVAERVFDVLGVLLLLSAALLSADVSAGLWPAILFLVSVALGGTAFMYLVVAHSDRFVSFVSARTEWLPHSMRDRVGNLAAQVAAGFGALRDGRLFYRILVTSIMQWALMGGCVFIALRALAVDVPYQAAIVVLATVVAGLTLPTSPGYFGTIQYCFVLGLKPFGVDSTQALAASIFYHALLWCSVTVTGLYYLHANRLTFADMRRLDRNS